MKKQFTIKTAQPIHALEIQILMRTVWLATYPNKRHNITEAMIDAYTRNWVDYSTVVQEEKNIESKPDFVQHYIAMDGIDVIGNCVVVNGKLRSLYVLPIRQGEGIGKALLKKAKPTTLEVAQYLKSAIGFYSSQGFEITSESTRYFADPQFSMPTYIMTRV